MMEGVLPEAWDLILFKTMVLYIYKTADNIKQGRSFLPLWRICQGVFLLLQRLAILLLLRILYITEAFYEISKLE